MIKVIDIIQTILKNSNYRLSLFSENEINALCKRVVTKTVRGKETPFVKCVVRHKDIQLKPKEIVRQLYANRLLNEYGYPLERLAFEHKITFGRQKKSADIVIFDKDCPNTEYIIVELKKPKLQDGKDQLRSYCHATNAQIGVWTNGDKISHYRHKERNYFEDLSHIPYANQKLSDVLTERWMIADLIKNDKLRKERKSLKELILEMEEEVLANASVDVFEEIFKLIFTKLYDEMESGRNEKRQLEFRNYGNTQFELKTKIQKLFEKARNRWEGVFADNTKIELTPSHLSICVASLQNVKLFNSNFDIVDEAFEYLINKTSKGEKGPYFTPRYVIDMCVKMLNPKEHETMIDTAAGSCGFPIQTYFYVRKQIHEEEGISDTHLFTAAKAHPRVKEYVKNNVFAIDFDEKAVRVGRTLNLIKGDGQTNVLHLNTLDYECWHERTDDDLEWIDTYYAGWKRLKGMRTGKDNRIFGFDVLMATPPFGGDIKRPRILAKYDLAQKNKMGRNILFIERNLDFLKPGGRMAVVLPQGRFNNVLDKYIREFIAARSRILAVVGLPGNVFKQQLRTKTSVLFLQKWTDGNGICPRQDDYPIFLATMLEHSQNNSSNKIDIIKNYNSIAEAFIKFAKKEKLSFFDSSPFDKMEYHALLEGLEVTEVMFNILEHNDIFRFDSHYLIERAEAEAQQLFNSQRH
ncbi:MAG: SAM-dependent methyltransferase [Candidatus Parabeggiatoa sp. nov. 3]|mgnify:CR=1 FL=1|nr:MAG: SAM-dependent methyltransferase [Gammaproteobacteria bacterium]RKZ61203.1 MAG: SAM-dependent methyltransferase [Gammaproteobacteria bacterium]RKZ84069.1 MAG: SAM-dependent methyltransferase [Gammaproteobacteria bacterium]